MTSEIATRRERGVLEIVFDRPAKKNALTNAMYSAFADALEAAEGDAAVRAVLIHGEGGDFTAGNDLVDFARYATTGEPAELPVWRVLRALTTATVPIVAAVQGQAVGIGTTLLLHCDLVYLAEGARLSTPFANLALVPEAASSWLLPQAIGHVRAFEMFALGRVLDAAEAVTLGLANRALAGEALLSTAREVAQALATRAPVALRATKRLTRDAARIGTVMTAEAEAFTAALRSPEAMEAFTAFMERRPADFSRF